MQLLADFDPHVSARRPVAAPATAEVLDALADTRERTLALVEPVGEEDLERVHSKLMSPLVWDLGHIAAFEDLWLIHRYSGRPLLRDDLIDVYDALGTPRASRGSLPSLRDAQAREYLAEVRAQTVEVEQRGAGDGLIAELVIRHLIGQTAITNATYLTFVESGGYERREWWSDEGWAWKEQYDITRPSGCTEGLGAEWRVDGLHPLQPDRPVVHVSWFEADAFARAHGARRPTEAEWEKAATWDPKRGAAQVQARGDSRVRPGIDAKVDHIASGPLSVSEHPGGVSPYGCGGMIGDTWEWTASSFTAYRGFTARPYREYSEVFFGSDYKVLRGGSWATRARVITAAFRNWDFPQRRQIFSGVRIARDL